MDVSLVIQIIGIVITSLDIIARRANKRQSSNHKQRTRRRPEDLGFQHVGHLIWNPTRVIEPYMDNVPDAIYHAAFAKLVELATPGFQPSFDGTYETPDGLYYYQSKPIPTGYMLIVYKYID